MMEGRPHQNSLSSFPRREATKKDTIPKAPLLFYTPGKPSFQLVKREDGEGHPSIAKENLKATENLVQAARFNGANVHNSTCSTPIKTPFGTPSQLQTPTSKLSFLSVNEHNHFVGADECSVNEVASITRTPFRLLAGKNLNSCLFSSSHTPRPPPSPFDKLFSPAVKGHAKRVFLMPPQLSPARRVPVKQKGSRLTTAGKQSPFATPKSSSRVDNVPFPTPKSSRIDNVPFATPKSTRVDNVLKAAGQNDDGNVMQHHDVGNVEVNHDKKNSVGSALPKRMLAFMPQKSPFATPNSSRVEHVFHHNNDVSEGKVMQQQDTDGKHERAKLDRLELLKRVLASMPQLSSPARRVPLRQKQKQPIKTPSPLHHKEKQQSTSTKSLPETPKACKSDQRRGKTCRNEAGVLDAKRQAAGHQNATKKQQERVPEGKGGNGADKAKQQSVEHHKVKSGSAKQHDDDINKKHRDDCVDAKRQAAGKQNASKKLQNRVPKGKGGNGADKAKQQSVEHHKIKSSKDDDDINKKYSDNCVDDSNDEEQHCEDRKLHKAAGSHQNATKKLQKRVPKGKGVIGTDKAKQQRVDDHKIKNGSSKQHDVDIDKKYRDDCVDDSSDVKRHCEEGKLHEACDVDVGRHDDAKPKQHDDDDGTKQHDNEDGRKHHEDGKCHFEDGRDDEKQHEDSHVEVGGDEDTKEHAGDGSKHCEDGNGIKPHDLDDDCMGVVSDDTDGEKQHGDENAAKQYDRANGGKHHNHDVTKQQNDDDADIEICGEE